jgi:hypothetical protein
MSSAAPTGPTGTEPFIPSLKNYYGVKFQEGNYLRENSDFSNWTNPYHPLIFVIPPYTFSCDQDLLESCNNVYKQNCQPGKWISDLGALTTLHQDTSNRVFVFLEPKDLVNFSKASKCCYLATKADIIWVIQFQKYFPKINPLPNQVCGFSLEQQFKMYFKRMNDVLKPYIVQLERNNQVILQLRGSDGSGGAIHEAEIKASALSVIADADAKIQVIHQGLLGFGSPSDSNSADWKALFDSDLGKVRAYARDKEHEVMLQKEHLVKRLTGLTGNTYDGTVKSIAPDSQQGRCLHAIDEIPELFNGQERFEKFMQGVQTTKNNSPQSNEAASL